MAMAHSSSSIYQPGRHRGNHDDDSMTTDPINNSHADVSVKNSVIFLPLVVHVCHAGTWYNTKYSVKFKTEFHFFSPVSEKEKKKKTKRKDHKSERYSDNKSKKIDSKF